MRFKQVSFRFTKEMKTRIINLLISLTIMLGATTFVTAATTVVITGATLIDVRTGESTKNSLVIVENDRLKFVGKIGGAQIPKDARIIDANDKWIIPGLMDMHAHVAELPPPILNLYLANGVTTIRDPGGNLTLLRLMREQINSGKITGPRLNFCGPILDGNPPVWAAGSLMTDTPQRAESTVNFLVDQGVDCIKVYNNITEPVLETIVRTAHKRGIPVIGHVPRAMTMTRAVELGMDGLEHIRVTGREMLPLEEATKIDFLPLGRRETLLWQQFDLESDKIKRLIALLVEKKIFLNPTLTVDENTFAGVHRTQAQNPNNRFLPREFFEEYLKQIKADLYNVPAEQQEIAIAGFKKRQKFIAMLSRAGVRITAGTDGFGLGTLLPGFGLQHELRLLQDSGLKPIAALRAATITAAQALRRESEIGSIETGKFADLVILNADPLTDISNAENIQLVIKGGQIYDPNVLIGGNRNK